MRDNTKKGSCNGRPAPTFSNGLNPNGGFPKGKRIHKTFNNLKITLLCGLITILVLRGTLGLGGFGGSSQDPDEMPQDAKERNLMEVKDGDVEEEEEEIEFERELNDTYSIGPRIFDWDDQRRAWLIENPELANSSNGKPRILLVTGSPPKSCDNPAGDHYLLKSIKNKIDYCRIHNIEIFYNLAHLDAELSGYWSKLPLIRKLMLTHPEFEWIWWMDSDAMFTDMVFELPLEKYKHFNFILHGWEKEIYEKISWVGLNTGSLLLRNCQWSLDLIDAWAPMGPKGKVREEAGKVLTEALLGRPAFEADDQSALIYLLITQRNLWGNKVYLENSFYLHGFWVAIVETYDELIDKHHPGYGDERWPFITHFVGCKPCGSYGDYSIEKCLKEMERSFNFGDNQILQMYGFQHRTLSSFKVERTSNDSDQPLEIQDELNLLHPTFNLFKSVPV
ncbi:hypothetical protein KP509_12G095000 [Ceratopteris richardii]|uniref:Uncharacterized protein n=1 Tax=Ceratopteris richardii TaxID=49495 RepID=A0A8T2TR29_CERRI|nr:hypothetical protein KP509_12G095000 [Ceratopteris richardii]